MMKYLLLPALLFVVASANGGCYVYDVESDQDIVSAEAAASVAKQLITTEAWGYAWVSDPDNDSTAPASFSRNSSGSQFGEFVDNTISHYDTGRYRVTFPGLGAAAGGTAQVTAYGGGSNWCKVYTLAAFGGILSVFVDCYDASGQPANTQFTVAYVRRSGTGGPGSAYLLANNPFASSYTPNQTFQFNSSGNLNTVERIGEGRYRAILPGQTANESAVLVTAYGDDSAADCKVQSWHQSGFEVQVLVRCFDENGALADSPFALNFARHFPFQDLSYSFVWANQSNSPAYTPDPSYQRIFVSNTGEVAADVTAGKTEEGRYFVDLPSMSATGSNVQVTAYGTAATHCKVGSWFAIAGGTQVSVACHNAAGQAADSQFVVVYSDDLFVPL